MAFATLPEPGSARGRLLALGLLVLAVGAAARLAGMPLWRSYQASVETLAENRYQLARYRAVAATLPARKTELARLTARAEIERHTLAYESAALAAAALQERIKERVVHAGGSLTSVRVLPAQDVAGFQKITVNVRAALENDALQRVLHDLESGSPYLVVDNLVVTSRSRRRVLRRGRRPSVATTEVQTTLDVQLDLSGLMRGPAPSGARPS